MLTQNTTHNNNLEFKYIFNFVYKDVNDAADSLCGHSVGCQPFWTNSELNPRSSESNRESKRVKRHHLTPTVSQIYLVNQFLSYLIPPKNSWTDSTTNCNIILIWKFVVKCIPQACWMLDCDWSEGLILYNSKCNVVILILTFLLD